MRQKLEKGEKGTKYIVDIAAGFVDNCDRLWRHTTVKQNNFYLVPN